MGDGKTRELWILSGMGVVLVFLVLSFNLISGRCLFKWDAWNAYWPWFSYLADSLHEGRIPLWDPRPACGFPFHAEPQTATFYPVYLIVAKFLGGGYAVFQSLWLGHWLWAILGFFLLAKRMEISPAGAFVGSMLFGAGGFFIGHAQHTTFIVAVSYVPWALLCLESALTRSAWYAFPAGVFIGLAGLGGYPGMIIYSGPMLALWCLLRFGPSKRVIGCLIVTFLVGVLVLSPAIVSLLVEGRGYTDRVGQLTVQQACDENRFTLSALVSLVTPALPFYHPNFFDDNDVSVLNGYVGIFGLLAVAMTALDKSLRDGWRWMLLFMLTAFLLSLGTTGGLRIAGYYLFPPLRYVRHSGTVRFFWMLGAGILAGWVFDRRFSVHGSEAERPGNLPLFILSAAACASVGAFLWSWLVPKEVAHYDYSFEMKYLGPYYWVPNSFDAAVSSAFAPLIIVALFMGAVLLYRTSLPRYLVVGYLVCLVVADAAVHRYTTAESVSWNDRAHRIAERLERTGKLNRGRTLSGNEKRGIGIPLFNLWAFDGKPNIRAYLAAKSRSYEKLVGNTWPPFKDTGFLRLLQESPRFHLSPKALYASEDDEQARALVRDSSSDSPFPVFLHGRLAKVKVGGGEFARPGAFGSVEILSYKPEEVVLRVKAPHDCVLFATERYAPGWHAVTDGEPTPILKANFCFRAVEVPKGDHEVRMVYKPWAYRPLMFLSWGIIAAVFVVWAAAKVASLRKSPKELS